MQLDLFFQQMKKPLTELLKDERFHDTTNLETSNILETEYVSKWAGVMYHNGGVNTFITHIEETTELLDAIRKCPIGLWNPAEVSLVGFALDKKDVSDIHIEGTLNTLTCLEEIADFVITSNYLIAEVNNHPENFKSLDRFKMLMNEIASNTITNTLSITTRESENYHERLDKLYHDEDGLDIPYLVCLVDDFTKYIQKLCKYLRIINDGVIDSADSIGDELLDAHFQIRGYVELYVKRTGLCSLVNNAIGVKLHRGILRWHEQKPEDHFEQEFPYIINVGDES